MRCSSRGFKEEWDLLSLSCSVFVFALYAKFVHSRPPFHVTCTITPHFHVLSLKCYVKVEASEMIIFLYNP